MRGLHEEGTSFTLSKESPPCQKLPKKKKSLVKNTDAKNSSRKPPLVQKLTNPSIKTPFDARASGLLVLFGYLQAKLN